MTAVLVIAEAGVNHNGDMGMARELIDAAAAAGADVVKFQTFSAADIAAAAAPKAQYQLQNTATAESQVDMLRRLELTRADHALLIDYCAERGIEFLSSPFDMASADLLLELPLRRLKLASGELTNLPLLRKLGAAGLPLLVSTGMADIDEIAAALGALEDAGAARETITLLHCCSAYPAPLDQLNLRAIPALREQFGVAVGYSDHTTGYAVALAATALGASVIEKHFTLDRALPGPDHQMSLEPPALAELIRGVRAVESALGSAVKQPMPAEQEAREIARKSIVAAAPIRAGDVFTSENLTVKRPATGRSPMEWDALIGTPAGRDYSVDEPVD